MLREEKIKYFQKNKYKNQIFFEFDEEYKVNYHISPRWLLRKNILKMREIFAKKESNGKKKEW